MKKLETHLTWALAILILGCLTLQDYTQTIADGWANQWGESLNKEYKKINSIESITTENIDSILQIVLEENEKYLDSIDNMLWKNN